MPTTNEKPFVLKWWPLIVFATLAISSGAVLAYQVEVLQSDMTEVQKIQKEQARTKVDIEYIQKDMEDVQEDVKDNKELLIKIWEKMQ
jgi:hypothetical protein